MAVGILLWYAAIRGWEGTPQLGQTDEANQDSDSV